jgi:hypothetical protein
MTSTFTPNKSIERPASGDYDNAWATPVNADWTIIDTALGGVTTIDVTGFGAESLHLTLTQYQPPNLEFTGTISGQLLVLVPLNVGGIWSISNATTGAFNLFFNVSTGPSPSILCPPGQRTLVISDGTNIALADTTGAAAAVAASEAFATAADVVVLSTAEAFATSAANAAQAAAVATAANANNLTSGTVANARLNNVGIGPGVIIQADPGGTPTGPAGTLWLYY